MVIAFLVFELFCMLQIKYQNMIFITRHQSFVCGYWKRSGFCRFINYEEKLYKLKVNIIVEKPES